MPMLKIQTVLSQRFSAVQNANMVMIHNFGILLKKILVRKHSLLVTEPDFALFGKYITNDGSD